MTKQETITYASLALTEEDHKEYEKAVSDMRSRIRNSPISYKPLATKSRSSHLYHESANPSEPNQKVAKICAANKKDVDSAVQLGKHIASSLECIGWEVRRTMLQEAIPRIEKEKYAIAATMALEAGKVRAEALAEIHEVIAMIHFYTANDKRFADYFVQFDSGELPPHEYTDSTLRSLGGPVAVISPFNFPFALAANHAIRNFLNGNPFIIKPSSDTPLSTLVLEGVLHGTGIPEEAYSFVVGPGFTVGEHLLRHKDIRCIAFTGSLEVGKRIMAVHNELFQQNIFRAFPVMEMGGKNPTIVTENADLEAAAEGIIRSAVGYTGQKCSAASRVYAHEKVYYKLKDLMWQIAFNGFSNGTQITIGLPWEKETYLGPLINKAAFDRYHNIIGQLEREKICPLSEPIPEALRGKGYFVRPALVEGIPHDHPLNKEEHFVPIVFLHKFSSLEQAVKKANDISYGLCAGIFSKDTGEIEYFLRNIQSGVVYVNRRAGSTTGSWPGRQSFGGWKGSGTSGRNSFGPWYALNFGQEQCKTVVKS